MDSSSRVILNTGAQYLRTLVNLCLSLISARLILGALGVSDYGIYTLIAGIISLLSFVINALVVTTQRFLSYYSGKGDVMQVRKMFANSVFVHLLMALLFGTVFELLGNTLFDGFFNITPDRIDAAKTVFHIVTVNVILSFVTAPFRALLIAHENIVFISFVDVIDAVFRLMIAIIISNSSADRLVLYALLLCGVSFINLLIYAVYDAVKYQECVLPKRRYIDRQSIKEMSGFACWTIYSIFCITGRTQGVAVIINKFFNVAVNAAYGIGMQVNASIAFLSQSIVNALNPQIMKAEGAGERSKMLRLSEIESKLCFMLLSMFLVPCIFEMPSLLKVWLGNVPDYSVYFCRGLLLASVVDQLTIGLGAANQAIGQIRTYSLTVNTIKFLTVPVVVVCLLITDNLYLVMTVYVAFELICALIRLFFLKRTAGLSISQFVKNVFLKELMPIIILVLYCVIITNVFEFKYRFILTIGTAPFVYAFAILLFGLCDDEKKVLTSKIDAIIGRYFPKIQANRRYKYVYGKNISWKNPKDLNEKIQWLQFNTDTTRWSLLSDKLRVRDYVSEKGYSDTLTKLYAVWESPESMDFTSLPDSYILKMNNGSGDAVVCDNESDFDDETIRRNFFNHFNNNFGVITAEPHYRRIKPCIMAEELLDRTKQVADSTSLIDYKIWCFNGRPECVYVIMNRKKESVEVMTYDLDWNPHPEFSVFSDHYRKAETILPRPKNFEKMLEMASRLSEGFPQVRVDLYEVDGKVYFGEMTFTSNAGIMFYFTPEYLRYLGDLVQLPVISR